MGRREEIDAEIEVHEREQAASLDLAEKEELSRLRAVEKRRRCFADILLPLIEMNDRGELDMLAVAVCHRSPKNVGDFMFQMQAPISPEQRGAAADSLSRAAERLRADPPTGSR